MKTKRRTVIIKRGGKPVTRLELPGRPVCLKDLPRLLRELPKLGAETEALKKDLLEIIKNQPLLTPGSHGNDEENDKGSKEVFR
jgi:hypothetical protein